MTPGGRIPPKLPHADLVAEQVNKTDVQSVATQYDVTTETVRRKLFRYGYTQRTNTADGKVTYTRPPEANHDVVRMATLANDIGIVHASAELGTTHYQMLKIFKGAGYVNVTPHKRRATWVPRRTATNGEPVPHYDPPPPAPPPNINTAWHTDAACPPDRDLWNTEQWDYTRPICEACPVRIQCLTYAMAAEKGLPSNHRWGMWGGLTAQERARLDHQTQQRARRATDTFTSTQWMTRKQVAAALNTTEKTISNLIGRKRVPKPDGHYERKPLWRTETWAKFLKTVATTAPSPSAKNAQKVG